MIEITDKVLPIDLISRGFRLFEEVNHLVLYYKDKEIARFSTGVTKEAIISFARNYKKSDKEGE